MDRTKLIEIIREWIPVSDYPEQKPIEWVVDDILSTLQREAAGEVGEQVKELYEECEEYHQDPDYSLVEGGYFVFNDKKFSAGLSAIISQQTAAKDQRIAELEAQLAASKQEKDLSEIMLRVHRESEQKLEAQLKINEFTPPVKPILSESDIDLLKPVLKKLSDYDKQTPATDGN